MILGYTLTTFPKSCKTLLHNQSNRNLWHNCKRNINHTNKQKNNSTKLQAEELCICKKLDTGNWNPTDPTGSPEHRKNHLDEVQAGSGAVTHQGDICVFKCFAILYCMAYDVLKQTMYWKAYRSCITA